MRKCPFCGSEIPDNAMKCRFCNENLEARDMGITKKVEPQTVTLVMGILSIFCFPFGIVAIILWAAHRSKVKKGLVKADSSATTGMIIGIIGIFLQIIFVIAMVFVFSSFFAMLGEPMTATQLLVIHKAQEQYKNANNTYATNLKQLEKYGVQGVRELGSFTGYEYFLQSNNYQWSCIAKPIDKDSKKKYLYIDQEGTVRYSDTEEIGPQSPPYQMPNSFNSQGQFQSG